MSHENVEIVRGAYQRFRTTGQFDAEIATPDFVWDMSNFHGWPEQQVYVGVEGAKTFLSDWTSAWDDWELELEGLRDAGDKVLALVRQRGRSKGRGCRLICLLPRSGPSAMARRRVWRCIPTRVRPSKPLDWRSNDQEQVSRERATSANARHECFVMDASVSVRTAKTAEKDDEQQRWAALRWLLLRGRLRACPRQRGRGSQGAAKRPSERDANALLLLPRGAFMRTHPETLEARKGGAGRRRRHRNLIGTLLAS